MASFLYAYATPKKDIPRRAYLTVSTLVMIAILAIWCALSYGGLVRGDFLPTPDEVMTAAINGIGDGSLLVNTGVSVTEIMSGFIIASVFAVPLGILMGSFKIVEAALEPVTNFVRYLPVSALIPLLILWVGIGIEEKITVIFIGTFFQQVILVADVSRGVPQDLLDVSYTLGANRRTVVARVLIPATLPGVMDTLRVTLGWAWTYLVVAELVAANKGLGYFILNSMRGLFTDQIFLGIMVIGLLGLVTDQVFKLLRNRLLPWGGRMTMAGSPKLRIDNVALRFTPQGSTSVTALENISLDVEDKEFSVIVGPSGCGKTSLLRLVAGLIEPTEGAITLDGVRISGPSKDRGMVFQSYTLFPWLTVRDNVEFGLRIAGIPAAQRRETAQRFIAQVGLNGFEPLYPKQLSGGMMQRVALARALANDPAILLMDEPFGALDSQTRSLMQELLLDIWQASHKTVLFITHDIDESVLLGDRVYVMTARPGRIKEMLQIELPRPRTVEMLTSEAFMAIKRRIMHLIHEEAMRSVATERPAIRS